MSVLKAGASLADEIAERLQAIARAGDTALLCNGRRGLEKESLRVTRAGQLAQTDHPRALGSALTHPYITTDYSEALPELITPSFTTMDEAVGFLHDLHLFVHQALHEEMLWAASMPCAVSDDRSVRIAEYGSSNIGRMKHIYRVGLAYRYGRRMQAIAGVHFNYSLPLEFWPMYRAVRGGTLPPRAFVDREYFGLVRNFKRMAWIVLYLFGNSPAACKSFLDGQTARFKQLDRGTYYLPYATSLRMSDIGYKNKNQAALHISYDSVEDYVQTLKQAIATPYPEYEAIGARHNGEFVQLNTSVLQIENEFYSLVRPKRTTHIGEKPSTALRDRGVEYVEMRALDLQIEDPINVVPDQLRFIEALLILCLLADSPPISAEESDAIAYNELTVALRGREPGLPLLQQGRQRDLRDWARGICAALEPICAILDRTGPEAPYARALQAQRAAIDEAERLPSARLLASLREAGLPFARYVTERSAAHHARLAAQALSAARQAEFTELARRSLEEQARLEAADTLPFEEYLRRYYADDAA